MRKSLKKIKNSTKQKEQRRKLSIRKKIIGTTDRPRICATKSNTNLFVQVIDDSTNATLFSVQTFGKNAVGTNAGAESAKTVGAAVAKGLADKSIKNAVFDRNGKKYTGVVAALADSIREGGIQI
jgi:large subunit ribosomal protein L18